jgi:hypothetical protein
MDWEYYIDSDVSNSIVRGLGIGDWGLGIGDWGLAQSPIPNPQSPILFDFSEENNK